MPTAVRRRAHLALYAVAPQTRSAVELTGLSAAAADVSPRAPRDIPAGDFILSGFLTDHSGVGRGARLSAEAFRRAGLAPRLHDLRQNPDGWGRREPGGVWFAHCNAPEAAHFLLRSEDPRGCYRVGYWAWELPRLPQAWAEIAKLFHEIWTPSAFVAGAVRSAAPEVPVHIVPHPLPGVDRVTPERTALGFPDGTFVFLSMFDVRSSATRKNPRAAIEAFQTAFDPDDGSVRLALKVNAQEDGRAPVRELEAAAAGWRNIQLIDRVLSDEGALRLLASADAFVSLHRSEGFGMAIAEAMALGRPVIATDWSGNRDFCQQGVIPIPFSLVPVVDPTGVYVAPQDLWAEPDLTAAADAMRRLADDHAWAASLGRTGRAHIRTILPRSYPVEPFRRWLRQPPQTPS